VIVSIVEVAYRTALVDDSCRRAELNDLKICFGTSMLGVLVINFVPKFGLRTE
jgi:hypothetical protein